MFWTILTGALGGLTLGAFSMWNTYKQIELHNQKLERMATSKTDLKIGKD
jgi:hypothetical protein